MISVIGKCILNHVFIHSSQSLFILLEYMHLLHQIGYFLEEYGSGDERYNKNR